MTSHVSQSADSNQSKDSVEYTPQETRVYLREHSEELLSALPEPQKLVTDVQTKIEPRLASNQKIPIGVDLTIEGEGRERYLWAILRWPNIITFRFAAGSRDFDGGKDFDVLEPERVKLYEPFHTLLVVDDGAGQAKHLSSVHVYMFVSLDLIDGFVTSAAVTREARKEGLVAVKAKQDAGEYKESGPPLKDAVRFTKKILERQMAGRSFGTQESRYSHLEGYLGLEGQLWERE